jgi:hypothetical protein
MCEISCLILVQWEDLVDSEYAKDLDVSDN